MTRYNYTSIYKFNNSNENKLNDSQIRILQHRLYSLDQIFREVEKYSDQKLNLNQLRNNIKNSTNIIFDDKDLSQFIATFNYNYQNSNFKEFIQQSNKINQINLQYGGNSILELDLLKFKKNDINNLFKFLLNSKWNDAFNQKINILI